MSDAFLSATEKPLAVEVPEYGITVYLRVMSAIERIEWGSQLSTMEGSDVAKFNAASLLARCLCDETGKRHYQDSIEDITRIAGKSFIVLDRLAQTAMKLNAINIDDDADDQKKSSSVEAASPASASTSQPTSDAQ